MSKRLQELRQQRAELQARISAQREQIAEFSRRYHGPLVLVDKGWSLVHFVYCRPVLIVVLSTLLVARRKGMMGLVRASWKVWKGYSLFKGIATRLVASKDAAPSA